MGNIRAIETAYNGYRFRSRLEARWAVFFETLGVQWEYEPEGFALPSGRWYLPDFYVHNLGWFEIKPLPDDCNGEPWIEPGSLEEEFFARDRGEEGGVLFGTPGPSGMEDYTRCSYIGCVAGDTLRFLCECPGCGTLGFQFQGDTDRNIHLPECLKTWKRWSETIDSPRITVAYKAARAARF